MTGTERSSEELAAVPRHVARLERERWAWQAEEERSRGPPDSSPSMRFTASGPALRVEGRQEEDRVGERAIVELGLDDGGYDRLVKEAGREEVGRDEQRAVKEGHLRGIKKKRASD
ncbi:hypothetical protein LTS18_004202 [Coniosporium uncinatum]|uniref:Uncharacterized protein n=1 Tax=Coniosporium uncinatum TaxID=93489 RepID=A0ACC3DSG9_9PEZI|nr:hypothetical protein LTS18_004202 [Coniosporium uncinatum]